MVQISFNEQNKVFTGDLLLPCNQMNALALVVGDSPSYWLHYRPVCLGTYILQEQSVSRPTKHLTSPHSPAAISERRMTVQGNSWPCTLHKLLHTLSTSTLCWVPTSWENWISTSNYGPQDESPSPTRQKLTQNETKLQAGAFSCQPHICTKIRAFPSEALLLSSFLYIRWVLWQFCA